MLQRHGLQNGSFPLFKWGGLYVGQLGKKMPTQAPRLAMINRFENDQEKRADMKQGRAYFSWGHVHEKVSTEELAKAAIHSAADAGLSFTHFTLTSDDASTRGAKAIEQFHRKWNKTDFEAVEELAFLGFSGDEFLTIFDAEYYLCFSRGNRDTQSLGFRTEEMLYRMRMDRAYFIA